MNPNASFGERALAAASIASEALPVSIGDAKDVANRTRRIANAADNAGETASGHRRASTLSPGPYAGESIPVSGPGRASTTQQENINRIGQDTGCHTCGATNLGTVSGNHVLDHQPPSRLNPSGSEQCGYPHCIACSRRQGGEVNSARRRRDN